MQKIEELLQKAKQLQPGLPPPPLAPPPDEEVPAWLREEEGAEGATKREAEPLANDLAFAEAEKQRKFALRQSQEDESDVDEHGNRIPHLKHWVKDGISTEIARKHRAVLVKDKIAALARRKKEELEREYAANPEEFAQKSAFLGNQIAGIWNAAQEEKRKAAADKEFVAHQEAREKEAVQKEAANLQKARDQALESASLSSKGMLNRQGDWSQSAKQYLVIAHEDATPSLKGRKGIQVECREVKGKQVEASKSLEIIFNPMCTDQNGELRTLSAPIGWVQYITELEAKTAQYNTKKQCTWANAELAKMILSSFSFEPKHSVPYDDLYELYAENIDAGIAEIEFRLLPGPGLVVVPASLAHLLAAFTQDSHDTIEEAESRAKFGNKPLNKFGETEKLAELLADKAEKGNTIIVPITDGKHWTLLVCIQKSQAKSAAGAAATNPLGASDKDRRMQAERLQFQKEDWPIFLRDKDSQWEVRYYDTLSDSSCVCLSIAHKVLELLTLASFGVFDQSKCLPVQNGKRQTGLTCGLWVLHYIEEEMRFYLGEKRGTIEPNLQYRRARINAMQEALVKRTK